MVSFTSSIMKYIFVFALTSLSKIFVKLICYIVFGSAFSACCLLKSIAISL